jgi:hypothetical protein
MGPHASLFELALQAFSTVLLGQYLSRWLHGPKKPKLSSFRLTASGCCRNRCSNHHRSKSRSPNRPPR